MSVWQRLFLDSCAAGYIQSSLWNVIIQLAQKMKKPLRRCARMLLHTQKYIILSLCGCFYFKRALAKKKQLSLFHFSHFAAWKEHARVTLAAGLKQKVSAALLFNVSALPLFIIRRQVLLHSNNYDCPLCERLLKWSVSPFSAEKMQNLSRTHTTGAFLCIFRCGFCVSCNNFSIAIAFFHARRSFQ